MANLLDGFPRPLWVVTVATPQGRGGLLASWLHSVSLDDDRPVALLALSPGHYTAELLTMAGICGIHLLGRDQLDVALHFALTSGREHDKLAKFPLDSDRPVPLLTGCLAHATGRVMRQLPAGDRQLYWLALTDIYQAVSRRAYTDALTDVEFFARIPRAEAEILKQRRQHDASQLVPLQNAWLSLP